MGSEVRRGAVFAKIHATGDVDASGVVRTLATGTDRSFAQDPLLAFRLLSDIGDRALSTAINDPATAVQALGCVQDLLTLIVDKDLDIGHVNDEHGRLRVVVRLPTWEEYLRVGLDEIDFYASGSPSVRYRVAALVADLGALAPPDRRAALERRLPHPTGS